MPTVSMFFGISIRMYYDDHSPPHFHAYYGSNAAVIQIATLQVLFGALPRRALALVLEWAQVHREELNTDWTLARMHMPLKAIEPLE